VTERDFTRAVLDAFRLFGWRTLHVRPARTAAGWRTPLQGDGQGWPDVFAVRGPRLIAAELKAERGQLGPGQAEWLAVLAAAGVETHTWRPSQWPEIESVLR
jgi:hypothetical protein